MTDWISAQQMAARTARWATTMTKVRIRKTISRTRRQLVTFCGGRDGESVGIVDLLAIRKNHRRALNNLKRGDTFEVVLIQVKGGGAPFPPLEDIQRLRKVARCYKAKAVILAKWKKGRQAEFFELTKSRKSPTKRSSYWIPVTCLASVFR